MFGMDGLYNYSFASGAKLGSYGPLVFTCFATKCMYAF